MSWQLALARELSERLPGTARLQLAGSATTPDLLDGWSDVDLHVDLESAEPVDLLAGLPVWAATVESTPDRQVVRTVLDDGRRLDLTVRGGHVVTPEPAVDNDVRFLAVLAAAKLGRGDRLIGLHLTLDLLRTCLVQAMMLRDRDLGTTVHRVGSDRDELADEVAALAGSAPEVRPRPNVVERAVALYARWRAELDPSYRPDWTGLSAVLDRGLGGR
ncbi:MAG TPA: hypothetical protein VFU98_00230 [Microlunatus sp.]|nr:hypothetical protein [Microlunatus sp.]